MIQPNEYRLGNIVSWNPSLTNPGSTLPPMFLAIASIHQDKIGYFSPQLEHRSEPFQDDLIQTETPYKMIGELEPVSLTDDVLSKVGFIQVLYFFVYHINASAITISLSTKS